MSTRVAHYFAVGLAVICLLGFTIIYSFELYKGARSCQESSSVNKADDRTPSNVAAGNPTSGDPNDIKDPYAYVVTILTGLVGGVVAVLFGQPTSKNSALSATDWKSWLLVAYGAVYILAGIAAVVEWMLSHASCPSILVKTLALTFLGLVVPVVTSFFRSTPLANLLLGRESPDPQRAQL